MDSTTTTETQHPRDLRCRCPFCWAVIDVNLDVRGRPYWVCIRCQTRTFGTRTTLENLTAEGLIWSEEPPIEVIRGWLKKAGTALGLESGKKKRKSR